MRRLFSPANEYTLLARLPAAGDDARYRARDAQGRQRLVVLVEGVARVKWLLPLLLDCRDNPSFTDFIEFFPDSAGLAVVFAWQPGGVPPEEALRDAPNPLRAALLRSLFTRLLLQEPPEPILREVLRPGNLLADASGEVQFLYALPRNDDDGCDEEDGRGEDDRRGAAAPTPRQTSADTPTPRQALADVRFTDDSLASGEGVFLRHETGRLLGGWARLIVGEDAPAVCVSFCDALEEELLRAPEERYAAADYAAEALSLYTPPPKPEGWSVAKLRARVTALRDLALARWKAIAAVVVLAAAYVAVGLLFYHTVIAPPRVDNGIQSVGTVVIADA